MMAFLMILNIFQSSAFNRQINLGYINTVALINNIWIQSTSFNSQFCLHRTAKFLHQRFYQACTKFTGHCQQQSAHVRHCILFTFIVPLISGVLVKLAFLRSLLDLILLIYFRNADASHAYTGQIAEDVLFKDAKSSSVLVFYLLGY